MKPDADGKYRGDCDDFVLTALFIETGSLSKFWYELIFGSAKVFLVTTSNGGGHAVLRYNGRYIDNWSRSWVSREHMESVYGHKFSAWLFPWNATALKMLLGKIKG